MENLIAYNADSYEIRGQTHLRVKSNEICIKEF